MAGLTSEIAHKILHATLAGARAKTLNPMAVVVLDARGSLIAAGTEDGASRDRWRIALAKANGAIGLGIGSRRLGTMAVERPHFVAALGPILADGAVPVAGGVLIRTSSKEILGAVGVSGDTSDHDEAVALDAITGAGFVADGG